MAGNRWGVVAALLALSALVVACGDDDSTNGKPTPGKHNGAKDSDAGGTSDDGGNQTTDRDAGSMGGGHGDGTGDFGSIWKRASSDITIIDPADPLAVVQKTVKLPAVIPDPIEGHDIDAYQQIKGDELLIYAHRDGDDVYYQFSGQLMRSDTIYLGGLSSGEQFVLTLEDGHLIETRVVKVGDISVSIRATFNAYDGDFPPKGWPTQMLEAP